jgi:predicted DNA-binding ribbon-helix-helix protein
MPRKLIQFHPEDFRALEQLAEDRSSTLQELIDKAIGDFLEKSGRPTNLRDALRESTSRPAPERRKSRTKRR